LKLPRPCAGLLQLKIGIQGENTTVLGAGKLIFVWYLQHAGQLLAAVDRGSRNRTAHLGGWRPRCHAMTAKFVFVVNDG